ncbi:dTMP kinase [Desulfosporosinus nitroreducens]|uniref:Thymidylate kinase n=1 Tax=Desulfosporosinus nitroreducens TaxID=2018668 RepID=A0ABT8QWN7_9FIRM|nr:deoxynucleoside kinase [Desulfosporosinus nitroreducens]MDO0824296.1 deoxynucleoside kinase [Desulfosporosinus nitroreducens]
MGKLIVVEGLDGSGKGTQSKLLVQSLKEKGLPVLEISFPDYKSDSSALVKMYLGGKFGTRPDDVNAYAASLFYAVDRFSSYKDWEEFYQAGGIVIADRYTTSNAVHQCSKLPEERWENYLDWLFDTEYIKMGIPSPDEVVYLDVDVSIGQQLLTGRYHGNEAQKDIHEKDLAYLQRSRKAAEYCVRRYGWKCISCLNGGMIRSIKEIHTELLMVLGY